MTIKTKLSTYRKKRDFTKTSEPSGKISKKTNRPLFVIQEHDATALHYDFRIEIDGVLKSCLLYTSPSPRD